jgi:hypothetical protein
VSQVTAKPGRVSQVTPKPGRVSQVTAKPGRVSQVTAKPGRVSQVTAKPLPEITRPGRGYFWLSLEPTTACAAASRAIGTRNGEQLT